MSGVDECGTIVHFVANIDGGVWTVVKTLAAYHRPRWRVVLVALYKNPLDSKVAQEANDSFDAQYLVRKPRLPGSYFLAPPRVGRILRALDIDPRAGRLVCHFHTGPYTPWVFRLPKTTGPGKWLACFHGTGGGFGDRRRGLRRRLYAAGTQRLLMRSFTLVAVSAASGRACAAVYGCRSDDFRVIHNGTVPPETPTSRTPPSESRPYHVGFVGALERAKGWHKVVAAVERLRDRGMNVRCSVVGEGPERETLQRLVAARNAWLHAPGYVGQPAKNVFPSLDVLVLPSEAEGHPAVILEAMSCGVPCICADVGGCAETVRHEQEGYVLRDGSVEEVAESIQRLFDVEGNWARMSRNGVLRHEQLFTAERMAADWERLYLEEPHEAEIPAVGAR